MVVGGVFLCEWWGFLLCLGVHLEIGLIFWGGVWGLVVHSGVECGATALVYR